MIDSHCHLAGSEFAHDLEEVIARARAAGLVRCLVILDAGDDGEFEQANRISAAWPEVEYGIGVHPHHAGRFADDPQGAAELVARRLDAVVNACALGEIGLDYHYDFAPRDLQQTVFRAQLQQARNRDLPVIIHTREADEDALRIIAEESGDGLRGVFHCFTGDTGALRARLTTGFYISIPGVATFPKSAELREAACEVPAERLLIETDSPYLTPVPHRGKRNEPAYVVKTLALLAELRGTHPDVLGTQLVGNFDRFVGR